MLLIHFLGIFLGFRACILLLVSVGKPSVISVCRPLDTVLDVRIPVAVLHEKLREAVLEVHLHLVIDVALGLVTDLISSYVSELRVCLHI